MRLLIIFVGKLSDQIRVPIVTPTVGFTCIDEHAVRIKQVKRANINLFMKINK